MGPGGDLHPVPISYCLCNLPIILPLSFVLLIRIALLGLRIGRYANLQANREKYIITIYTSLIHISNYLDNCPLVFLMQVSHHNPLGLKNWPLDSVI